jgi:hypothetical protein
MMIEEKYESRIEISPNRNWPLQNWLAAMDHIMLKLNATEEDVKSKSWVCNVIVPRVPNENAETSLRVTWQHSNIDIMERHIKQLIHMVRGMGVLPIC